MPDAVGIATHAGNHGIAKAIAAARHVAETAIQVLV